MTTIKLPQARRIALAAQGFSDPRPSGTVGPRQFRKAMNRMTILQLDSVNVIARSHFLPMLARLGPYDRDRLDKYLYRSGEYFEYLSHEASLVSQQLQPLLRHRAARRSAWVGRTEKALGDYTEMVFQEVEAHGPLSVKTLSDPGGRTGPWWGHSKGKQALDLLYMSGRLAIKDRNKMFVTLYDIPERVFEPGILELPEPAVEDAKKQMLLLGARSHGIGTAADLADYFRLKIPESKPLLAELVEDGLLEQVTVEGWKDPAYLHLDAKKPRAIRNRALLSPFDPVCWFRPRAERLFNFHYRIEIYVPEPKRIYGYYVLPFLVDDELVARVDLKADRKAGVLRVKGSYAEDGVDKARVCTELIDALEEMAGWLGLQEVSIDRRGDLSSQLRARAN